MKITELLEKTGWEVLAGDPASSPDAEGVYCGDLLSWVMGRAEEGNAWLTIMSNQNVAAVAVMVDLSCIVLTEGVRPDGQLLERAKAEQLNLLGTSMSTYEAAAAFAGIEQQSIS